MARETATVNATVCSMFHGGEGEISYEQKEEAVEIDCSRIIFYVLKIDPTGKIRNGRRRRWHRVVGSTSPRGAALVVPE